MVLREFGDGLFSMFYDCVNIGLRVIGCVIINDEKLCIK